MFLMGHFAEEVQLRVPPPHYNNLLKINSTNPHVTTYKDGLELISQERS